MLITLKIMTEIRKTYSAFIIRNHENSWFRYWISYV